MPRVDWSIGSKHAWSSCRDRPSHGLGRGVAEAEQAGLSVVSDRAKALSLHLTDCHRQGHQPCGDLILRPVILTLNEVKGKNLMSSLPPRLPRLARNDRGLRPQSKKGTEWYSRLALHNTRKKVLYIVRFGQDKSLDTCSIICDYPT